MSRPLLGTSRALLDVIEEATYVAATNSKVLITGESGVGKELLARYIHQHSRRASGPMITLNCAGVPETLLESELFGHVRGSFTDAHRDRRGLLELAHGGTVLLDEIGEMSLRMQALLLRFLEHGEIQRVGSDRQETALDVRVIAATNRDLLEQVKKKEFREDLFYRLNVVHLILPPLRERPEDVNVLLDHYTQELSSVHRMAPFVLAPDAVAHLESYAWPGNARELKNVVERLVLRFSGKTVTVAELPREVATGPVVSAAAAAASPDGRAAECYERMTRGRETFWAVVYEPFLLRDLTRETVRAVVRRGLEETRGSYRLLAELYNLPPSDYKRLLNFLQKYGCHLPFQPLRAMSAERETAAVHKRLA